MTNPRKYDYHIQTLDEVYIHCVKTPTDSKKLISLTEISLDNIPIPETINMFETHKFIETQDIIVFNNCTFENKISFSSNNLFTVTFNKCSFADFIYDGTRCENIIFSKCTFQSIQFNQKNSSRKSINSLSIIDSTCKGQLSIKQLNVYKKLFIHQSILNENFIISDSEFFGDVNISHCTFIKKIEFKTAHFHSSIIINNNTIKNILLIHNDCVFPGINHLHTNNFTPESTKISISESCFSILKNLFPTSTDSYYKFHALELRSKYWYQKQDLKNNNKKIRAKFYSFHFSNLYYHISDYGNKIMSPFVCLLGTIATTTIILFVTQSTEYIWQSGGQSLMRTSGIDANGFLNSFIVSIKGLIAPIYKFDYIKPKSGGIIIFILSTIIQFTFIGFFITALRRRFKAKQ